MRMLFLKNTIFKEFHVANGMRKVPLAAVPFTVVRNTRLHGSMPKQWVQPFCLAIVNSSDACVLFKPTDVGAGTSIPVTVGPLIQLPAQHATSSINVTLASKIYTFDYNNPDSICGIAHATRSTGLLWGIVAALLLATLICICLWRRCK